MQLKWLSIGISFFYNNRRKDKLKIINYTIDQINEYKRKFTKFL